MENPEYSIDKLSIDELERADRQSVEAVSDFAETVLSEQTVEDYLSDNVLGASVKSLYKDILIPFVEYLREQTEYHKVNMILAYCEEYEKKTKSITEMKKKA